MTNVKVFVDKQTDKTDWPNTIDPHLSMQGHKYHMHLIANKYLYEALLKPADW